MKSPSALIALVLFAGFALPLCGSERVAFVIGNNAYPDVPLENAVSDARAVRAMLTEKLAFPEAGIVYAEDADQVTIFEKFETFKEMAASADIVVVFYAGHGMESLDGKENFLIPVDADVVRVAQSEAVLRAKGVNLMLLTSDLAAATSGAKIILMDCCRERPAGRGVNRAGGGLVTYVDADIPADTLMILAAAPDRVASDGDGHGPFTEALLEVLPGNERNLMDAFFAVSDRVKKGTSGQQVPWMKFEGAGQIFREQGFLAAVTPPSTVAPAAPNAEMVALKAQLAAEKKAREEAEARAKIVPSTPAPSTETTMSRPAPVPTPAFPASRGMEGSRAGEMREFGGIEMVWCPPGEFTMGSPAGWAVFGGLFGEVDGNQDETQHRVTLTKGFWLAKTETTQGQWAGVMGTNVTQQKEKENAKGNPSGDVTGEGANQPMYFVSWDEAQEYLAKMNSQNALPSGWKWDLPSEAQWEYACRAGTTTKYAGDLDEMAWYDDNSGSKTNPVGTKKPNAWGLHDMHGNVEEWCGDYHGDYESGSATDPKGATSGVLRVTRGGWWHSDADYCRAAHRDAGAPTRRVRHIGFRPALVPSNQ